MVDKAKKEQDPQPDAESLGQDRGVGVDEETGQVHGTGDGTSSDFVGRGVEGWDDDKDPDEDE